jgi:hypothetical protein
MYLQCVIVDFNRDIGTKSERASSQELETYLRYAILEANQWRPATRTSVIVSLRPKDGISRRYWVNGTLFGLRYSDGKIRELALQAEAYPRFPTLRSLEEYVKSRLPYEDMSQRELQCLTRQLDKRFLLVGRTEVRDFRLNRRVRFDRGKNLHFSSVNLRWDIPTESWGVTTWRAYFYLYPDGKVRFLSSRVSCHVYILEWFRQRMPHPWRYEIMEKPTQPRLEHPYLPRALNWLMVAFDGLLKQKAIVLSFEDDPISGMPEDIPRVTSIDEVKENHKFRPPEDVDGSLPIPFTLTFV